MNLSAWLTEKMRYSGLTQSQLAEALGTQQSAIWNWLHGKRPGARSLASLAEYFDTDITLLYQMLGDLPPIEAQGVTLNADEIEIFRDLEALRDARSKVYPTAIIAIKALLDVAKTKADSPDPGG